MSGYPRPWALCGGWSLDAWLGRETRTHGDLDISILLPDQRVIFDHLAGWHLVAHDATVEHDDQAPWDGRPLHMAGPGQPYTHVHCTRIVRNTLDNTPLDPSAGPNLEVILNEQHGDTWVVNHHPRLVRPASEVIVPSPWGVLAMAPEVTLLHKSAEDRRRDHADFRLVLPILSPPQRAWLREALSVVRPGHSWMHSLQP
jgi:hypothetical protein